MKKKLVLGFSAACLAGSFWACGSGDVINSDDSLEGLAVALLDQIDVADAVQKCGENPQCQAEMANPPDVPTSSSETAAPTSSTATPGQSSAVTPRSSMSFNFSSGAIGGLSSAALPTSSEAAPIASSSSVTFAPGDLGACAPGKATGELNETVTYTFTWNSASGVAPADMLAATYNWSMPDGTPATSSGKKTASTNYTTSGPKTASVTVTAGGKSQEASCGVNINGAAITGCKCVPTNIEPDVFAGEAATWTATGCTTVGAEIIGYTWVGATADATGLVATAPVVAKGDVVTGVSFTVANNDNTVVTVPCDDAKAIDSSSPDYLLEVTGGQISQTKIEVQNEGCITVRGDWDNEYYTPTITVVCDAKGTNVDLTIKYGTGTPVNGTGAYGVNNITLSLGQAKAGPIEFSNVCVTFTGADVAECGLGTK